MGRCLGVGLGPFHLPTKRLVPAGSRRPSQFRPRRGERCSHGLGRPQTVSSQTGSLLKNEFPVLTNPSVSDQDREASSHAGEMVMSGHANMLWIRGARRPKLSAR